MSAPESRLADYAAMTEFLLQILRVTQEAPTPQSTQPSPDTMQRVMAYINEHYAQPLTLEEIADAFFISKSYLSHEFVRYTNTSVYEYIQFRRICGAKLLIASGVSLTEAAFQSGFNSYSSFLRTFRKNSRHFADGFPAKSWQIAFALSNADNFFPDISARFA